MCITVTRAYLPKMRPYVNYRRYKNFDLHNFRYDLNIAMDMNDANMGYEEFENTYLKVLNKHAPIKQKLIRVTRSRLRNR